MIHIREHERYAPLQAEVNTLGQALGKVQCRLREVEAELNAQISSTEETAREKHVEAALAFAASGQVVIAGPLIETMLQEKSVLQQQEEALRKTLNQRSGAFYKLGRELSAEVAREFEAIHKDLAYQYLTKLEELEALCAAESGLIKRASEKGYEISFRQSLSDPSFGSLNDGGCSVLYHHARALRQYAAKNQSRK